MTSFDLVVKQGRSAIREADVLLGSCALVRPVSIKASVWRSIPLEAGHRIRSGPSEAAGFADAFSCFFVQPVAAARLSNAFVS